MASNVFKYDHPVGVSAGSGELLGTGRFVGEAGIGRNGVPRWSGNLSTDIDPLILVQSGELRLEFDNAIVGYAFCTSANITAKSGSNALFLVRLRGRGGGVSESIASLRRSDLKSHSQ